MDNGYGMGNGQKIYKFGGFWIWHGKLDNPLENGIQEWDKMDQIMGMGFDDIGYEEKEGKICT